MEKNIINVVCIVFWFCCAAILTTPSTCSSNETDWLALLAFRAAIVADPLGALNSWNQTQDYCSWKGIFCGSKHPDRVVEINLMSQGLVGSLSPHVGNLSFLKIIDLQNNTFHGEVPQEIGRLRKLEFVDFNNNSFVGEIPRNVSQCPNLIFLNLIDNSLSGIIPDELGALRKLEQLGLGANNFSGLIPPFLGNLTALVQLALTGSNLRGEIPESLAQLHNLQFLVLARNALTGRIPSGLFNISTMVRFEVSQNHLQGVIPENLMLPNLQGLYLGSNQFTGEIPASLSNSTSLDHLSLYNNSFKGTIPREFGRLSNLVRFVITYNLIEDDIGFIALFANCTNLMILGVSANTLTGSLPDSMSNFSSTLYDLEISFTKIHGSIPSGIGNLVGLTRFIFHDNYLEGAIPVTVGKLSNLHELSLDGNRFTYDIPYSLGNLTLLNILSLERNSLSGSIPPSLGNCINLLYVNIGKNNLDGSVPPQLVNLSSISIYLGLSYNGLTGSIPFETGVLTHLTDLDLSYNRLSGQIPNSLSGCTSLVRLRLQGNSLQGQIPPALSDLQGLQILDLSRNNLSGDIPLFLGRLNIEYLNLSFNRLKGEVPSEGVFRNKTEISVEGNAELCGGIPELMLPPCSSSESSNKHWPTVLKILIPTLISGGLCIFIYFFRRKIFTEKQSTVWSTFGVAQFMRLSYEDLLKATGGFSEGRLVGAGRFGFVYKGILDDGKTMVAVKVVNLSVDGASKSFIRECITLKQIRHRNLLKLLSVCDSTDFQGNEFKALVFEFMSNGSLEDLLHHNKEQEEEHDAKFGTLDMLQRLKIGIEIAHALEYLHIGIDTPIIHGDLKPSNVLIDDDMTAHVGDFGLSNVVPSMLEAPECSSTIGIKGTIGYIPPEYGTNNSLSVKGDVYSYGIVLLEMFTGKRPTDLAFDNNLNLHDFIVDALPNRVTEIIDPLIQGNGMESKMKECVASIMRIGVACSRKIPIDRICMTDVVHELCKIRDYYIADD